MKLTLVNILLINISLRFSEKMLLFIHLSTKLVNCRELDCNMAQLFADIFTVIQIFSSCKLLCHKQNNQKILPLVLLEYPS